MLDGNYTPEGSGDATRDNIIIVKMKNVHTAQLNANGLATPLKPQLNGQVDMGKIGLLSQQITVENCQKQKSTGKTYLRRKSEKLNPNLSLINAYL
nr:hypothetical protein [uncultured Agrobacterium sp.]